MNFNSPSKNVGVDGYQTYIPGGEPIALNPDFTRSTGFTTWDVPVTGKYIFKLVAKENATLFVDGRKIAEIKGKHSTFKRVDMWVSLSKGLHVFKVDIENDFGDGGFAVGMMIPPTMFNRLMKGEGVALPTSENIDSLWQILSVAHYAERFLLYFLLILLLTIVLPITVLNRPISLLITTSIIILPALLIPVQTQREPFIGKMVHRKLEEKKPHFVFIGNSMLSSRIDDKLIEQLTGGKRAFSIVNFGGLSAVHYLAFKYLVLPAKIKPEKVFVMFRGVQFHFPRLRINDLVVKKGIERITPSSDPVFEKIVHGKTTSFTESVFDFFTHIFPVAKLHSSMSKRIHDFALQLTTMLTPHSYQKQWHEELRSTINNRFAYDSGSLRTDITGEKITPQVSTDTLEFHTGLEDTFLPSFLHLAKQNNIQLVFLRVQERPTADGPKSDPPVLQKYMEDMKTYLAGNGAYFYDFTGDPELPLSAYHDGDHIADAQQYTRLFVRRLGDLLQ